MTRIEFDPNVRVRGNGTFTWLPEGVSLRVGDSVVLFEPEGGIEVDGKVTEIDTAKNLVYFTVDWPTLREIAS